MKCLLLLFTLLLSAKGIAQYPIEEKNFPTTVYWGDTHLHTNLSVDANGMGNRNLTPDDAYRFAKGESVTAHNGRQARLFRTLDFLVVADHAVNLGVMPGLANEESDLLKTDLGKKWLELFNASPLDTNGILTAPSGQLLSDARKSMKEGVGSFMTKSWYLKESERSQAEIVTDKSFVRSSWSRVIDNAERHNNPGHFTTFIGYEWTAQALYQPMSAIHRVIIFKDDADRVSQVVPLSYYDSDKPEELWSYLEGYEQLTGGEAMAIPHNSNLSNGVMFSISDSDGKPITAEYSKRRSRWEPLVEVTQIKGDSEVHPVLSPNDEFADYGTWNGWPGWKNKEGWEFLKKSEYVRSALALGISQKAKLGVNPFKFGVLGSTDAHTSLSTADDNNFWGKFSIYEPSKHRASPFYYEDSPNDRYRWGSLASGYAAIWAEKNTRESLFAAMKRKEVYATTGPRITVRFFGGWDYHADDAYRPDLARIGYEKGVPMGGDLTSAPADKAPSFLIRAVKDPDGANLDRVQVIKGWHDTNGKLHEKIYNVALSDGRKDNGPKTKRVGNTVDVPAASYTNTIGDSELSVVWRDPDFDQAELAFYYLRVLEIPTPRWTAYDAKYFKLKNIPDGVPMITQERAYSSPIWYTPAKYN